MTKNVAILGANGQIARQAVKMLASNNNDIHMTLLVHHAVAPSAMPANSTVIVGDATKYDDVVRTIKGAEIVYASLAGEVKSAAETIVKAMDDLKIKRLIWTSSLGIYNEIPGEFGRWNQQVLGSYYHHYRLAADIIERSNLDYTIIRPAWLTNLDEVDYETTHRDDPFKGTEVSRKSVAAYAVSLINNPGKDLRDSIGVDKPGTDGDRPRPEVMAANGGYEPAVKKDIPVRFK